MVAEPLEVRKEIVGLPQCTLVDRALLQREGDRGDVKSPGLGKYAVKRYLVCIMAYDRLRTQSLSDSRRYRGKGKTGSPPKGAPGVRGHQ